MTANSAIQKVFARPFRQVTGHLVRTTCHGNTDQRQQGQADITCHETQSTLQDKFARLLAGQSVER